MSETKIEPTPTYTGAWRPCIKGECLETKRQRDALLAAAKGVFEGDDPDPEELRPAWRALYDAIHECEQGDA